MDHLRDGDDGTRVRDRPSGSRAPSRSPRPYPSSGTHGRRSFRAPFQGTSVGRVLPEPRDAFWLGGNEQRSGQEATQMAIAQYDGVVKQLAADRADKPLSHEIGRAHV